MNACVFIDNENYFQNIFLSYFMPPFKRKKTAKGADFAAFHGPFG